MRLRQYDLTNINEYKLYLIEVCDINTGNSILVGFTWNSIIFSMSDKAQINWSNILNVPDELFPLPIMSKDDNTTYQLQLIDKTAFYLNILNFKNTILQAGTVTKNSIKACTTIAELDTIKETL